MKTDEQVARYRKLRESGKSQELAAAMSSMTAKTARKYEVGPLPSQTKAPRDWRTRPDPFQKDWDTVVEPLLAKDEKRVLQATTVLEELKKAKPDQYSDKELRTLQRRMREWRAVQGPPKEVFFPQDHRPGREAQME